MAAPGAVRYTTCHPPGRPDLVLGNHGDHVSRFAGGQAESSGGLQRAWGYGRPSRCSRRRRDRQLRWRQLVAFERGCDEAYSRANGGPWGELHTYGGATATWARSRMRWPRLRPGAASSCCVVRPGSGRVRCSRRRDGLAGERGFIALRVRAAPFDREFQDGVVHGCVSVTLEILRNGKQITVMRRLRVGAPTQGRRESSC
jgi:hypothetical protein